MQLRYFIHPKTLKRIILVRRRTKHFFELRFILS